MNSNVPEADFWPAITSAIRPRPGRESSDLLMDTHLVVSRVVFVAGQPKLAPKIGVSRGLTNGRIGLTM